MGQDNKVTPEPSRGASAGSNWDLVCHFGLDKRSKNAVDLRGFEPLTFCMPYRPRPSPSVARHRPVCQSPAAFVARCGLTSPCACRYWLPTWLPANSLAPLMFEGRTAPRTTSRRTTRRRTGTAARPPAPPGGPAPGTGIALRARLAIRLGKSNSVATKAPSGILMTPREPPRGPGTAGQPPVSDAKLPPMRPTPERPALQMTARRGGRRPPGS
jgi:hypothetical protein